MRTKILSVYSMAAFFGAPVQAASTEQGAPAYASTLRRAVIFENDTDSKLPLADRMERWKVPGLSVAVIDGCKIVDRHGFGVTRSGGMEGQSDTLFQAAPVTKPIAAFGAVRRVDKG